MLKKTTAVVATLSLCLLAACGGGASNTGNSGNSGNAAGNATK